MKFNSTISFLVGLTLVMLMVCETNACTCNMSSGLGLFCGHHLDRGSMMCMLSVIYQCGGLGTTAVSLGTCVNGCIETPSGQNDRCHVP